MLHLHNKEALVDTARGIAQYRPLRCVRDRLHNCRTAQTRGAATDTATAIPWFDGGFKICGLQPGTYKLLIHSTTLFKDTTIENINVSAGNVSSAGTITLHL